MDDIRTIALVYELDNIRQARRAKELRERGKPYLLEVCRQINQHPEQIQPADEAPLFV